MWEMNLELLVMGQYLPNGYCTETRGDVPRHATAWKLENKQEVTCLQLCALKAEEVPPVEVMFCGVVTISYRCNPTVKMSCIILPRWGLTSPHCSLGNQKNGVQTALMHSCICKSLSSWHKLHVHVNLSTGICRLLKNASGRFSPGSHKKLQWISTPSLETNTCKPFVSCFHESCNYSFLKL